MAKDADCPSGSITLTKYATDVFPTDVLPPEDINRALMGLYGEVGGIMTSAKKHVRERSAYPGFRRAAEEEFGDTLWYFNAVCRRVNASLEEIFAEAAKGSLFTNTCAASDAAPGAVAHIATFTEASPIDDSLFRLGFCAAELLRLPQTPHNDRIIKLVEFARTYLQALHSSNIVFADVVKRNILKARGAFLEPNPVELPIFDSEFDEEECLPSDFRIRISQGKADRSYLRWNNVFIGDPLTDNISDPDGYRFHDVFHLAYAAILHWSPVFRALIKQKRKSKARFDEEQDSGRAIVVEEGLTAWIFMKAKELNYFEGQTKVSFDILKIIEDFTSGYEVSQCPLKLWERAILDGYVVFRQIRDAKGGWVIGNRAARKISFEPL
ncbi:nucleoside triphosphate pyrophosphohydrolase family protein [Acidovorax sp. SUPP3434]|uniref:nucleoside triphosphate pyrophosphohydrolase family protein n=1 Tax=Acidovorax sp. SUPP3434 TaxID=2920880 RepID=UPI0023DE457E|nr:nucleoside triphosphate pyrophosphohydrolase family protein [Acidovorax sp. SUPP3434]GKT00809.1 nucleoside triphosphate pyrophosphohydrolase family protein [Acidovorax sp. SUPP3434]